MPNGIDPVGGNRPPADVNHRRQLEREDQLRDLEELDRKRERSEEDDKGQNVDTYA